MNNIKIEETFGAENPKTLIMAELSCNHLQDKQIAIDTIKAAAKAGVDVLKLQTYTEDTLTLDCTKEDFQIKQGTLWDGMTLHKLYSEASTPWEWHQELKDLIEKEGMIFFSTAFDTTAVDFLEEMDVPVHKISSFEITDIPLIEHMAKTGKPMFISTGIANYDDIVLAVETCKKAGNKNIILLKCTSAYPAPLEEVNLKTLPDIKAQFGTHVGVSDHTMGAMVPILSVFLGGRVIEKHFILDRNIGGHDAPFSMEPEEMKNMIQGVRAAEKIMRETPHISLEEFLQKPQIAQHIQETENVEKVLGKVSYEVTERIEKNKIFSKSLYPSSDIREGETLTTKNIRSVRPGFGIHPKHYQQLIGKKAKRNIEMGERVTLEDFE